MTPLTTSLILTLLICPFIAYALPSPSSQPLPPTMNAAYAPHPIPKLTSPSDSFFEGWYTRVTSDSHRGESIGIILGSVYRAPSVPIAKPNYIGLLYQPINGKPVTYDLFPSNDFKVYQSDNSFTVNFYPHGYLQHNATTTVVSATFPEIGKVYLEIRNGASRIPWPNPVTQSKPNGSSQPGGTWASVVPLPISWYVETVASPVIYRIPQLFPEIRHGKAHMEKNWGRSFPETWLWGQATSNEPSAQIIFSGGVVFPSILPRYKSWLIGYRSPKFYFDIAPVPTLVSGTSGYLSVVEEVVDPLQGVVKLRVELSSHVLEIEFRAPVVSIDSFMVEQAGLQLLIRI